MAPNARWLGYAGLLPFICLPLGHWLGILNPAAALPAFLQYSAVILSFLGGVHWTFGTYLGRDNRQTAIAMLPSIIAWLALVLLSPTLALVVLPLAYLALLVYDFKVLQDAPGGYLALRTQLTLVAVISHGLWW